MKFSIARLNRQIIDTGVAALQQTVRVELPVFVAIGTKSLAGVVIPLIGKAHGDASAVKRPKFFDQPILQLLVPLTNQKLNDGFAAGQNSERSRQTLSRV
jgi:hypothetical protein